MNLTYTRKCISLFAVISLGAFGMAFSQEDRTEFDPTLKQPPASKELAKEGDSYSYPETTTESRVNAAPVATTKETVQKDSVSAPGNATKTLTPNSKQTEKKNIQEDESVLSFNFLYYIIQRFKLSDIIE
jgi:hypothetical protein